MAYGNFYRCSWEVHFPLQTQLLQVYWKNPPNLLGESFQCQEFLIYDSLANPKARCGNALAVHFQMQVQGSPQKAGETSK